MDLNLAVFLAALWGITAAFLTWLVFCQRRRRSLRGRLERFGLGVAPVEIGGGLPSPRTIAGEIGARLAPGLSAHLERLARLVDAAGVGESLTPEECLGWKAVAISLAGLFALGLIVFAGPGASLLAFGAVGMLVIAGPDFLLGRMKDARQAEIVRALTMVMDLLALTLGAGMGLDRAMRTICDRVESPMTSELRRVLNDVDLGLSRREAFARMAQRVPLEDVRALTNVIIQSEDLGTDLAAQMDQQTRQLRISRRRAAEAEAHRAPIKMMIPMVVLILPSLFVILIVPVVLRFGQGMAGGV